MSEEESPVKKAKIEEPEEQLVDEVGSIEADFLMI